MAGKKKTRSTRAKRFIVELKDVMKLNPCRNGLIQALTFLDDNGLVSAPSGFMDDVRLVGRDPYANAAWDRVLERASNVRISLDKRVFTQRVLANGDFRTYVERLLMKKNRSVWIERAADKLGPALQRRAEIQRRRDLKLVRDCIANARRNLAELEARQRTLSAQEIDAVSIVPASAPWSVCESNDDSRAVAEALVEVLREQEDRG